jgi:hypothetical protein
VPYLFLFGFDGTEGDLDFGLDDFTDTVEWGGYIRVEVWNEETWTLIFDGGMTWLDDDFKLSGGEKGEATFRWGKFDLMVARRLVDKKVGRRNRDRFTIDAFGGLRAQHLRQELKLDSGGESGDNATWLEPVVGGRVRRQASSIVTLLAEGDASGFGEPDVEFARGR